MIFEGATNYGPGKREVGGVGESWRIRHRHQSDSQVRSPEHVTKPNVYHCGQGNNLRSLPIQ